MLSGGSWAGGSSRGSSDAFHRFRISTPSTQFESQLTYDLQPLLFEQITAESGATIAHDSTNANALMTFSSTPTNGKAYMQSYEHIRYQPSKSQLVFITGNFIEAKANCTKFFGLSDGTNGYEFILTSTGPAIRILSNTTNGNQTIEQTSWNLDKMNGSGTSGITLDVTKSQIFVIDFQALYVGRVRFGLDCNGTVIYVHEFSHANVIVHPYIRTANLPIRVGMTCTGTVSTTMKFQCCSVSSEGGQESLPGFNHVAEGSGTAGSGARAHILSVRPKTTFNSIANRTKITLESVDILVTGSNPIYWELVVGQAITGASWSNVNATYSSMEQSAGSISGDPTIVLNSGYVAASNQVKNSIESPQLIRVPITLDAAGVVRALGTLSILATGFGGTSACRAALHWRETR